MCKLSLILFYTFESSLLVLKLSIIALSSQSSDLHQVHETWELFEDKSQVFLVDAVELLVGNKVLVVGLLEFRNEAVLVLDSVNAADVSEVTALLQGHQWAVMVLIVHVNTTFNDEMQGWRNFI